jgi:hypothetical protein
MLTANQISASARFRGAIGIDEGYHGGPCDRAAGTHSHFRRTPKDIVLKEQFKELLGKSDEYNRWACCYRTATNPVSPEKSKDPVYRKLNNIIKIARKSHEGLGGYVSSIVYERWMTDLEQRKMPELTQVLDQVNSTAEQRYNFLLNTSAHKLYQLLAEHYKSTH